VGAIDGVPVGSRAAASRLVGERTSVVGGPFFSRRFREAAMVILTERPDAMTGLLPALPPGCLP
jgi:hypothetical protein